MPSFISSVMDGFLFGGGGADVAPNYKLGSITFPVGPEKFDLQCSQNNQTININNYGEYLMVGKQNLKSITLSSFLPVKDYTFASACDAEDIISTLEDWRENGTVQRFSIEGSPVNFPCLIMSFKYGWRDGTGDYYFDLELKEYRYVAGEEPTVDDETGLADQPIEQSFLENVATNLTYYPGDNPMTVVGRAVGAAALTGVKNSPTLDVFKNIAKNKKINPGDVLSIGAAVATNGTGVFKGGPSSQKKTNTSSPLGGMSKGIKINGIDIPIIH